VKGRERILTTEGTGEHRVERDSHFLHWGTQVERGSWQAESGLSHMISPNGGERICVALVAARWGGFVVGQF